jgi:chromosomal replication initiation ATPase DnaA
MTALSTEDMRRAGEIAHPARPVRDIAIEVALATGIPLVSILGPWRGKNNVTQARQLIYYIAHQQGISDPAIGRAMGRDHTTVRFGRLAEQARRDVAKQSDCG